MAFWNKIQNQECVTHVESSLVRNVWVWPKVSGRDRAKEAKQRRMSGWQMVPCHITFDVLRGKGGCWARCGLREEVQAFLSSSFCFSRHRLSSRTVGSITAAPLCRATSRSGPMCSPRQPLLFSRAGWLQGSQPSRSSQVRGHVPQRRLPLATVAPEVECGTPGEHDGHCEPLWLSWAKNGGPVRA